MRSLRSAAASASLCVLVALTGCGDGGAMHHDSGVDTGTAHVDGGGTDLGMTSPDLGGLPVGCGDAREPCCRGTLCSTGLTCVTGTCEAPAGCGASGQPCCSGTACATGLVCMSGSCASAPACGAAGQPCCGTDACSAGLVCDRGACNTPTACGGTRQPCCSGTACAAGLVCTAGSCDTAPACGDVREPCCGGTACNSGLTCTGGTCDSPTAPPDTCAGASGCDACTGMGSCGFCKTTGACAEGSSLGPSTGACADWAWFAGACAAPDPCASSGSCDSCAATAGCGYCRTTGTCETGTSGGPASGTCGDWAWLTSECAGPADPCGAGSPSCGGCTSMSSCGYCRATGTCATGTTGGPTSGTCSDWVWLSTGCAPPDPCGTYLTCGICGGASGCGWCEDDATCRSGNSSGPRSGSCGTWDYVTSRCPPDPCSSHSSTCDGCVPTAGCGYCQEDNRCRSGSETGPSIGRCNDWRYSVDACPSTDTCQPNLTCGGCAATLNCGWCTDGAACRTGDAAGPTGGTCSGWTYSSSSCG